MTIEIEEFDHLNHSPGFALAARGWADLIESGLGPHEANLHYTLKTITARLDGMVVGVIVWDTNLHNREAWIQLGYVDPDYRRRGIYTALYARVVDIARRESLRSVAGGVNFKNDAMRAAAERQGRKPLFVTYQQVL